MSAALPEARVPPAPATRARGAGTVLPFLCLTLFIVYLDTTIVHVALPAMQKSLGAGLAELQWLIDAYVLVFACLVLTAGALSDILGRKRIFLLGVAGFTLASAACAASTSIAMLLAARAIQGVFAAMIVPVCLAIMAQLHPEPKARARALGQAAGVVGLATALGPVAGGLLLEHFSWQGIFWVNVPIGVLAWWALMRLLPADAPAATRRLDPLGQALMIAGIGAATFAMIEGNRFGWLSPPILGSTAVTIACALAFVRWEALHPDPLLPLDLFRHPAVSLCCAANFFGLFGFFMAMFLLTLYFQRVEGLGPLHTGLRFLYLTATIMVASPPAGRLVARLGPRGPLLFGSACSVIGLLGLAEIGAVPQALLINGAMIALGLGIAVVASASTIGLFGAVTLARAGAASGASSTMRQLGAVFGIALAGMIVSLHMRGPVFEPPAFLAASTSAFRIAAACSTLMFAAIAWWWPKPDK